MRALMLVVCAVLALPGASGAEIDPVPASCGTMTIGRCVLEIERQWNILIGDRIESRKLLFRFTRKPPLSAEFNPSATGSDPRKTLDRLADRVIRIVGRKPNYTTADVIRFFNAVHFVLRQEGYEYRTGLTLSFGLRNKRLSCSQSSLIYLDIAERIGLMLNMVTAPGHVFVRFTERPGEYVNWETTSGKTKTDEWYVEDKSITSAALANNAYLKALSQHEVLGVMFLEIGYMAENRQDLARADAAYSIAVSLLPGDPDISNSRGRYYRTHNKPAEAVQDFKRVILTMDPDDETAWGGLGPALRRMSDEEALATLTEIVHKWRDQ